MSLRHFVFCTRLCNANVEDGGLVFLWKVLRCSFEAESAVLLFHHFKDSNGVSIRQPGDERPAVKRWKSVEEVVVGLSSKNDFEMNQCHFGLTCIILLWLHTLLLCTYLNMFSFNSPKVIYIALSKADLIYLK